MTTLVQRIEPLGVVTDAMLNDFDHVDGRWIEVDAMTAVMSRRLSIAIMGEELTVAGRWANALDELFDLDQREVRDLDGGDEHRAAFLREAIELDAIRAEGRSLLR